MTGNVNVCENSLKPLTKIYKSYINNLAPKKDLARGNNQIP